MTRLLRIARLVTLPETRHVIVAAARSETVRELARQARSDRSALVRDLRDPANARDLIRNATRHPAVRELANAGVMLLPIRYVPLGLVATWVTRRVLRRYVDRPTEVLDMSAFGARRPMKNVTPDTRQVPLPPYR